MIEGGETGAGVGGGAVGGGVATVVQASVGVAREVVETTVAQAKWAQSFSRCRRRLRIQMKIAQVGQKA